VTHDAIKELLQLAARQPAFHDLQQWAPAAASGRRTLSGLTTTAKALYLALLWQVCERPLLVIVDGSKQAETLLGLCETFFDLLGLDKGAGSVQMIPALDAAPYQGIAPHAEINEKRGIGLYRLSRGQAALTIVPVGAALLRAESRAFYRHLALTLRRGEEVVMGDVTTHLSGAGYTLREPVEMVGEYSVRGGILDVFPVEASRPVRIEFFGDEIESMRSFDVETQRSVVKVGETTLLPMVEYPGGMEGERSGSILELAERTLVVMDEPEQIKTAAERLWKRLEETGRNYSRPLEYSWFGWEELEGQAAGLPRLDLRELNLDAPDAPHIPARPSMVFHGNMAVAVAEARTLVEQGNRVMFLASSAGEVERLADIFNEYGLAFRLCLDPSQTASPYLAERAYMAGNIANILIARGRIERGVQLTGSRIVLVGSGDLFETSDVVGQQPVVRGGRAGAFSADIGDLQDGDFVVHATHGIGQFLGIRELAQGEMRGDYMLLEYAGGAKLYVPLARMDLVQKFRGAGESAPGLDRLGGVTWEKTKSRVKARMRDMAEELLKLYAQRQLAEGFAFSPDSNWQREFEDAFEYTPTKDQIEAVKDIKRDMEQPRPMDRLLCGDVGFGKTEVAMRAMFKALGDGRQVAVLAPTTVLCFQHFETFKRRFAAFPIRVEMFSRFRSKQELAALAVELAEGKIDVAVGTHRLLSGDIEFRDLGLLVIDEEQRFGVRHKERLKQMRQSVDVLSMSATPIPRTLHMSMLGLRDLSVIETPPKDRLAIHTVVAKFNPAVIKQAIEQELARGGQVYFLHNRVDSIYERAAFIQSLVPEARIGIGHGQMTEAALENVMLGFMRHEFDVLVSTTIIENGLDIPKANTIIIEHAERHGLSELYQLRGRVGRSNRRAYAYLLVPEDAELTDVARKRLAALKEFSDLGSGFKIAALDLELRGAGEILSGQQHGHMNAVGYDTYMTLLEQTVKELRGEQVAPVVHATMNLGLDLRIPATYIADEHQRLRTYKKVAELSDAEQARLMLEGLSDRYGSVPDGVKLLIQFALIKTMAERAGISSIDRKAGQIQLKFHEQAQVDPARLFELVQTHQGAQFTPAGMLAVRVGPSPSAKEFLTFLQGLIKSMTAP
jgi:transcription-repair coupling factor (superfamily II helicase)